MTPIKATVLASGWQAQVKNPFEQYGDAMETDYQQFEATNPPLDLTTHCEPGSEVYLEPEPVWQIRSRIEGGTWMLYNGNVNDIENNRVQINGWWYDCRKVYQPIPAPKLIEEADKKISEIIEPFDFSMEPNHPTLTVQKAAVNYLIETFMDNDVDPEIIKYIYSSCANHILTSGEYVSIREMEKVIRNWYFGEAEQGETDDFNALITEIKNLKHTK